MKSPYNHSDYYTEPLPRNFYAYSAPAAAQRLIGCILYRQLEDGRTASGRIVETEAYTQDDPACHAFNRRTRRCEALYGAGGHAYVYFTYGVHFCFNVVCGSEGWAEGVLIRAVEPLTGLEMMAKNRGIDTFEIQTVRKKRLLCSGPGKICQAMQIDGAFNGHDLTTGCHLWISRRHDDSIKILSGVRVGISKAKDREWRFMLEGSTFISK